MRLFYGENSLGAEIAAPRQSKLCPQHEVQGAAMTLHEQTFLASAAALALLLPVSVAAQTSNISYSPDPAEVTIRIAVEQIAVLTVIDDLGTVVVDDPNRAGFTVPTDPSELAELTLQTNFCISSLEIDFPRVTGLRGDYPSLWYGQATGNTNLNTLGVTPYMITPQQSIFYGGTGNAFGAVSNSIQGGTDSALATSGISAGFCSPPNGVYEILLGAITKWDLTLAPEPLFAAPDVYTIPLTVSIVP